MVTKMSQFATMDIGPKSYICAIIDITDMTRQTLLRYFLAAVLIAGGCQEKEEKPEIENPVPEVNDVQTKVLIDVQAAGSDEIKKCEWGKGERVYINGKMSPTVEKVDDNTFGFTLGYRLDYPHCLLSPITVFENASEVNLPQGHSTIAYIGYAENDQPVSMKSLTGVIRIPVVGEVVEDGDERILDYVVVTGGNGEQMWGRFSVDYKTAKLTGKETEDGYKSLEVKSGSALSADKSVNVEIHLPAGTYSGGLSILLRDTQGDIMEIPVEAGYTVQAGKIQELPIVTYHPEDGRFKIKGTVKGSDGTPLADVVVSDGLVSVLTDAKGRWAIPYDKEVFDARFISVSTPAKYAAPVRDGLPIFYMDVERCLQKESVDFVLDPIVNPYKYTLLLPADPQIRKKTMATDKIGFHSIDCMYDLFDDLRYLASSITDQPCYGLTLGDIVHEDMSLYTTYTKECESLPFPMYNCIGNHDHDTKATSEAQGHEDYELYLGPRNYSVNLGMIHVVVLDNIIMSDAGNGKYSYGLTDQTWEWLQGDLAYVAKDTPLVICTHATMFLQQGPNKSVNGQAYVNLLRTYDKVYNFAGHAHTSSNYVYESPSPYKGLETHVIARSGGQLWVNDYIANDGTPCGYLVCKINDKDIKWRYRTISIRNAESVRAALPKYSYRLWTWKGGVGYIGEKRVDDSIQIQAYGNNTYGDGCVYANVFMWDEKWSEVTLTTSTGKKYVMSQVPTDDPNAYDAAESELVDHYLKYSTRYKELNASRLQGVTHLFRVKPDEKTGKGTVSVTDRFGDTFTYEVAW